ncbi:MAG: LysR family transcriptional regulator [Pseudomonadales bacterium]
MVGESSSDLDWNLIRTFVSVAERGSLAAASRELALAHPTVARHVQNLEAGLGLRLFDRRASGLVLNAEGRELLAAARGMLDGARRFDLTARTLRTTPNGPVRITASEFMADVFPELLAPLRDMGEETVINIELLIGNDLLNLLQGEADIAIRHVEPQQQELVCRRLAGLPIGLYASRAYVAERGMPTAGTAERHWFIDGVAEQRLARHARRLGYDIGNDQFVFRSDSFAGRLNGAVGGWGITVVPLHVAARMPELVRVLEDVPFHEIDMWLVGRQDVRATPYLAEVFRATGDLLNAFATDLQSPQEDGAARLRPARKVSA